MILVFVYLFLPFYPCLRVADLSERGSLYSWSVVGEEREQGDPEPGDWTEVLVTHHTVIDRHHSLINITHHTIILTRK
jgi:hypothetical protein